MNYYKFPVRKAATTDRQKAIRKLDDIFSEYIRLRDCNENGFVKCVTCPEHFHWRDMDCGHFVKRCNSSVRWDLQNSHGQCRLCNSTHDGREDEHALAIDRMYGEGTAERLRRRGAEDEKFMVHELESMYQELRKEVKALKDEKFK
jgi:hypothetical protein